MPLADHLPGQLTVQGQRHPASDYRPVGRGQSFGEREARAVIEALAVVQVLKVGTVDQFFHSASAAR